MTLTTDTDGTTETGDPEDAAPREPIRVLVADDQALVRTGFAMVIDSQSDMKVVGLAADGEQAVGMAGELRPDVVLMDIRMPLMDGIEATRRIVAAAGDDAARMTRVIILTTFDLDEYVMSAILAGASGFLLKDAEPETLLADIRTVASGAAIIEPDATRRLVEQTRAGGVDSANGVVPHSHSHFHGDDVAALAAATAADSAGGEPEAASLSEREREILVDLAHGLSNKQIAAKRYISVATVKTHVAHILAKTNSRDRIQAAVFAYQNGLA